MAFNMEWSPDFCLSCDHQIAEGGAYCSQACRLADLEKAKSPTQQLSSSASSSGSSANSFHLPPPVNFSKYKTTSRGFDNYNNGAYYAPAAPAPSQSQLHNLSTSSSRSSLASGTSQATGISAQAASQLYQYHQSFDLVRENRRKTTRDQNRRDS